MRMACGGGRAVASGRRPPLLAEPSESVEQDVQRELEFELLIATAPGGRLAGGCRHGDLHDVRVLHRDVTDHGCLCGRVEVVRVVESSLEYPPMRLPRASIT